MMNEKEDGEDELCVCPSFNSYSTDGIAEIAERVAGINTNEAVEDEKGADNNYDDDFEFPLAGENQGFSAEEFFCDGQIKHVFPVFNRDLSVKYEDFGKSSSDEGVESIRIPLKKFFVENRENEYPSSSSEADELETIPLGTYCVWRPKVSESSPSQCKKSKSTGSASKRWRFRDLLRRCNSDGKESFVILTPKHKEKSKEIENPQNSTVISGEKLAVKSPQETFYVRNRTIKEGEKKKSYLPYRQDLVGGLARSFPTF